MSSVCSIDVRKIAIESRLIHLFRLPYLAYWFSSFVQNANETGLSDSLIFFILFACKSNRSEREKNPQNKNADFSGINGHCYDQF